MASLWYTASRNGAIFVRRLRPVRWKSGRSGGQVQTVGMCTRGRISCSWCTTKHEGNSRGVRITILEYTQDGQKEFLVDRYSDTGRAETTKSSE